MLGQLSAERRIPLERRDLKPDAARDGVGDSYAGHVPALLVVNARQTPCHPPCAFRKKRQRGRRRDASIPGIKENDFKS